MDGITAFLKEISIMPTGAIIAIRSGGQCKYSGNELDTQYRILCIENNEVAL